jgi:hypothetical protein
MGFSGWRFWRWNVGVSGSLEMKKNEVFSASDVAKSEAKTVENGVQKSTSESPVG